MASFAAGRSFVNCSLTSAVLTLFAVLPAWAQDAASQTDAARLQGKWKVVALEEEGKNVLKDKDEITVVFKGDKAIYDEKGKKPDEATFKVNATKKPKHLDLVLPPNKADKTDKGMKIQAIYELDGDTLKLCYRMPPPTAKDQTLTERPMEFDSRKGGTLLRLQRVK